MMIRELLYQEVSSIVAWSIVLTCVFLVLVVV